MHSAMVAPSPWMILPFALLLGMIASGPLFFAGWWAKHYPKVALGLGLCTLIYYLAGLQAFERVFHVAHEYVSFIVLIGSLFVVSGGIHIHIKGQATPLANVVFLFIGAVLANVLGTTGASMVMIRPWIRMNKYRITAHHIVFFIFIISNVGGCLTPVGDPPLFLGYLRGVPFWWVAAQCWPMWLVGVGILLAFFFLVDLRNYYSAPKEVRQRLAEPSDQWRFEGLWNLVFLLLILGAVFVKGPLLLRELLMFLAAGASYFCTWKSIHEANHFNFHPIKEVALLFVGIFATMMPALDWLQLHAGELAGRNPSPGLFYWGSGSLSSVLDNAPTYLSFLSATFGIFVDPQLVTTVQELSQHPLDPALLAAQAEPVRQTLQTLQHLQPAALASGKVSREMVEMAFLLGNNSLMRYLAAISIGAVFFGANTYIGNGPNFLVKSIAEDQKVNTPGFIAYILRFTLPFMLPMLFLVWFLFFRR
jgi:Na+/H+ antiporter NhaD/arsenite permease-like protein